MTATHWLMIAGVSTAFVSAVLLGVPRIRTGLTFSLIGWFLIGFSSILDGSIWYSALSLLIIVGSAFLLFLVVMRARILAGRPVLWAVVPPQDSDLGAGRPSVPGEVVKDDRSGT